MPDPLAQLRVNSCPLQPAPTTYTVADLKIGTQNWIVVKIDQPGASIVGWFDRDNARRLATLLQATASGIAVAGPPDPTTNGGNHIGPNRD